MIKTRMKEEKIYCAKCNVKMKRVVLSQYEYRKGKPRYNLLAHKCPKCDKIFFTEHQAKEMGKG